MSVQQADLPRLQDPKAFAGWFRQVVFMRCTRFTRKMRKNRRKKWAWFKKG